MSKFRRIVGAVPHALTDRDMAIIAAVAEYRLLSRSQIQQLLDFGTAKRVNFRLQKLFHTGYLQRHFLPTLRGSSQAIYTLDKLGLPVAAERLAKDIADFRRPKEQLKPLFLAHQLALNDVRIAFELAARSNDDHQLLTWLPEEKVRDRFFFGTAWQTLTPDAFLRYRIGNQVLGAFLEVDRGTMANFRFKERVERYFAYDVSGSYAKRYQGQRFRVFLVTLSAGRLANLKAATAQIAQRHFWFTTLDRLQQDGVLGAIWEVIGREGKVSLLGSSSSEPAAPVAFRIAQS